MTQEKKQLLLKDLCSRLPYGVIINTPSNIFDPDSREDVKLDSIFEIDGNFYITEEGGWPIEECKPYLRPMSSMTKIEKEIYKSLKEDIDEDYSEITQLPLIDWLNKSMFDYRGLIPRGFALEAIKGMYNI